MHYAAACSTTSSLEFLDSVGANFEDVDKEGITPLMMACMVSYVICIQGWPKLVFLSTM